MSFCSLDTEESSTNTEGHLTAAPASPVRAVQVYKASKEVEGQIPLQQDLAGAGLKNECFPGKFLFNKCLLQGEEPPAAPQRGREGVMKDRGSSEKCQKLHLMDTLRLSHEDLGRERLMLKLL